MTVGRFGEFCKWTELPCDESVTNRVIPSSFASKLFLCKQWPKSIKRKKKTVLCFVYCFSALREKLAGWRGVEDCSERLVVNNAV